MGTGCRGTVCLLDRIGGSGRSDRPAQLRRLGRSLDSNRCHRVYRNAGPVLQPAGTVFPTLCRGEKRHSGSRDQWTGRCDCVVRIATDDEQSRWKSRSSRHCPGEADSDPKRVYGEADSIQSTTQRVEAETDGSCEVYTVVGEQSSADAVLNMAVELGSDLIVTPFENDIEGPSPQVRELFESDFDVIAFRPGSLQTNLERMLVPVRKAGVIAQTMLGAASRIAGDTGWVSVCSCISRSSERYLTERMLSSLVETIQCPCETHVAQATIVEYLNAPKTTFCWSSLLVRTGALPPDRFHRPRSSGSTESTATSQ